MKSTTGSMLLKKKKGCSISPWLENIGGIVAILAGATSVALETCCNGFSWAATAGGALGVRHSLGQCCQISTLCRWISAKEAKPWTNLR